VCSQELLLRGRFGAQQSVMDRLHLMAECLGLHQAEYELKVRPHTTNNYTTHTHARVLGGS
jgi:hypothetical protein